MGIKINPPELLRSKLVSFRLCRNGKKCVIANPEGVKQSKRNRYTGSWEVLTALLRLLRRLRLLAMTRIYYYPERLMVSEVGLSRRAPRNDTLRVFQKRSLYDNGSHNLDTSDSAQDSFFQWYFVMLCGFKACFRIICFVLIISANVSFVFANLDNPAASKEEMLARIQNETLVSRAQGQGVANEFNAPAAVVPPDETPLAPADVPADVKKEERITLDLKGVDIIELFRMLSVKSGLTIISSPLVNGRVTVFLNNLTFEDALDVIVTVQDLAFERKENVIKIMTADEYEKAFGKKFSERKRIKTIKLTYAKPSNIQNIISALKSDQGKIIIDEPSGTILLIETPQAIALIEEAVKELDQPLETAVFDINYARSADVKTYVNAFVTPGLGQVIVDERNSKVIVSDLPQRLIRIRELMKEIDESSRQVMLTAEIVQVDLNNKFNRGIEWEKVFSSKKFHSLDLVGKFPINPVPANHEKISVGTLNQNDYSVVLQLLQEYGRVETVSQPRILAVNNEEAKILIGVRDAFVTQTLSQGQSNTVTSESVQFIDVGVKLRVVPTINKQGFITMRIKPEISSVKETITTTAGSRIPIVQTSESESVVKIKDGTMIIIAGFMRDSKTENLSGVPVLSKIPIVGALFGTKTRETPKSELVVFLTPKLVSGETPPKYEAKNDEE